MRRCLKNELWKALHDQMFYLALLMGLIIVGIHTADIAIGLGELVPRILGASGNGTNASYDGISLFVEWLGVDCFHYGGRLFYLRGKGHKKGGTMKKRIICAAVVLALAAAWVWRYVSLNNYWKSTIPDNYVTERYAIGDTVAFEDNNIQYKVQAEGYSLRVDGFQIADYETYMAENHITLEPKHPNPPDKIALVTVTLFNEGNTEEIPINFADFALYGIDQMFSLDYTLTPAMNPVLQGYTGTRLQAGGEHQFVLVYAIYKMYLSNSTWANLDGYDMYFRVTAYPETKEVKVQ